MKQIIDINLKQPEQKVIDFNCGGTERVLVKKCLDGAENLIQIAKINEDIVEFTGNGQSYRQGNWLTFNSCINIDAIPDSWEINICAKFMKYEPNSLFSVGNAGQEPYFSVWRTSLGYLEVTCNGKDLYESNMKINLNTFYNIKLKYPRNEQYKAGVVLEVPELNYYMPYTTVPYYFAIENLKDKNFFIGTGRMANGYGFCGQIDLSKSYFKLNGKTIWTGKVIL